jgi:uncharacterized membrane protein YebE (DUF533 family)
LSAPGVADATHALPLATPAASAAPPVTGDPAWQSESPAKRFETVTLIALPFMALYSSILTAGTMLLFQKGRMKLTTGYQAAGLTLAFGASAWIAWKDAKLRQAVPSSTPSDI